MIVSTLAVVVDNEAGVGVRVIGEYFGRGCHIESVSVGDTDHAEHWWRFFGCTSVDAASA